MSMLSYDWSLAILYLVALVLALQVKRYVTIENDRKGFLFVVGGIMTLAFVEVARIYYSNGYLEHLSLFSDARFFSTVSGLGVVLGSILLAVGVAQWLPIVRKYRQYNQLRVRKLDFLRKTEQLIGFEGRFDVIMKSMNRYMIDHFDLESGVVLCSESSDYSLKLVAEGDVTVLGRSNVYKLRFSQSGWDRYLAGAPAASSGMISGLDSKRGVPQLILPLKMENNPKWFFLLWEKDDKRLDLNDKQLLKLGVEILDRKIRSELAESKAIEIQLEQRKTSRMLERMSGCMGLKGRMTTLSIYARERIAADAVSLTIYDMQYHRGKRTVIGQTGAVLEHSFVETPWELSVCTNDTTAASPEIIDDTTTLTVGTDAAFKPLIPGSIIALRKTLGSTVAILQFHSAENKTFDKKSLESLSHLDMILETLIAEESVLMARKHADRRLDRYRGFCAFAATNPGFLQASQYAARLLSDELGVDLVRISAIDRDKRFMRSRVLEADQSSMNTVPESGSMILEVMPFHSKIIETGNSTVIPDVRMDDTVSNLECRQIFSESVKSIAVVPVTFSGRVRVLIDIATLSSTSSRLQKDDLPFVESIADFLALAVRLQRTSIASRRIGVDVNKKLSAGDITDREMTSGMTANRVSNRVMNLSLLDREMEVRRFNSELPEHRTEGAESSIAVTSED